ncbi:probable LRR receptor-like serine/threonine-protein kinase At1g05700 isoform X2 [Salvia splendens]|uniref:probable LRR receptor-like serine/threonine-protein kinase At1g05700 isoform X2 n=1 Tax=Salvia splendens TaxID=180675 RepID=UPI001C263F1A|nr:probable LRR receptor-like serine/threonine-protein kinase At1g05700 isoform X2 [Salvia splendens]
MKIHIFLDTNLGMASRWFLISLVFSLCTILSTSADVFISIDCGSSIPNRDENGITWVGDDKYVQSGESRSIKPLNSRFSVADTLRVFTTRNKNCYHIDSVKKGRVLVRASFYYGNYDGKSFPPTFDIHFDGNFWTTVHTSNTEFYYYEVTYVLKRESISVCLAQTKPGQFPFISALEVRSLESSMYNYVNDSYPLLVWKRVAFGSNKVLRYQDDPYDRLWNIGGYGNGSIPVSGDSIFTQRPHVMDNPPPAVLRNAITAKTLNTSVELLMGFPSYEINVFINWYFSEVTRLGPGQNRSFRIFKDNESYSEPIIPLYGDCVEMILDSAIAVSSNTTFSLVPTNVSTLPPLINALEIFQLPEPDDKLTDGTNKKDVEGLASLQERFKLLQSWTSDPCLPAPYTWDWIKCSLDPIPRASQWLRPVRVASGFQFHGCSSNNNNSLQGPIPDFLGTLPNLKILNFADNQFNGSVPASLSTKKGLNLTVSGNPGLCASDETCHISAASPTNDKKKNILELLFAAITASIFVL